MNHEISNAILFDLFRARVDRRWANIQKQLVRLKLRLQGQIGDTFRFANAANERVEAFINDLNGQHFGEVKTCKHHPENGGNCRYHGIPGNCDSWRGDVVQPPELCEGEDWGEAYFDGQRRSAERHGDDLCGMEHEIRAEVTRQELGQRSHGYSDGDGSGAGKEGTKVGRDRRFNARRVSGAGRQPA